jgi:hypothetical protein
MNLDLTDEQRRQIEAHSACVVPMASVRDRPSDLYLTPDSVPIRGFRLVIPQPWLDATKPCETCDGKGSWSDARYPALGHPCPDCRDGQPIVELRAPVHYDMLNNAWVGDQRRVDLDHVGPESKRKMRVSLGRYTVELIAVIKDTWLNGIFDPLPVPGSDMVAVLTKVDQ